MRRFLEGLPWTSRLFLAGLLIRILLLPFFGFEQLRSLFIPFLDFSVLHDGANPWAHFSGEYFPYGSLLFAILYVPKKIAWLVFGDAALGTTALSIALIKLPLLFLDLWLFKVLSGLAEHNSGKILKYYWLNPIVLFITYVLGQLDIASSLFCILSLRYMMRGRYRYSAAAMAAATLCKFHVVVLIPLVFALIWNRKFLKDAIKAINMWLVTWGLITAAGFIPLALAGKLFYASTSSPEANRLFSLSIDLGQNQVIFSGLLLVFLVLGRICIATKITDRAFFFGTSCIFGSLLLVTRAAPGWYFWVVPFLAVFFSVYSKAPILLLWTLSALHVAHFAVFDRVENIALRGLSFTLLQATLLGTLITVWMLAVRRGSRMQGRTKPLLIGLAGDSGSGKNYFTNLLYDLFGAQNASVIEGDDYHKWERRDERWQDYTHLNPRANYLNALASHAGQLAKGLSYRHSRYDHQRGTFSAPEEISSAKTVIIQGLHSLYLRGLRSKFDLKIFLNPDEQVRTAWKLRRDVKERGHTVDKVLESLAKRKPDSRNHILPQREFADWIVEFFTKKEIRAEEAAQNPDLELMLRMILWNDAPISSLVENLSKIEGLSVRVESYSADINRIAVIVEGRARCVDLKEAAMNSFPHIRNILRVSREPIIHDGYDGVLQLFAIAMLDIEERANE